VQEQRFEAILPGRRTTLPQAEHFHARLASNLMRKPGPLMGSSFKLADLQADAGGIIDEKGMECRVTGGRGFGLLMHGNLQRTPLV